MIRFLTFGFTVLMLVVSGMTYAQENNSFNMAPLNEGLAGLSFLENEAGISAYGQISSANLDLAENAFKNVEKKTAEYIIGSVALTDYGETHDVHVYVDISGWIIAYYLTEEKVSKIIDWKEYKNTSGITSTKLSDALVKVSSEMYQVIPSITYYDFRYPGATNMLIATDEVTLSGSTETFQIMVPSTYFLYSRTWSHAISNIYDYGYGSTTGNIKIDDDTLNSKTFNDGWSIFEGDITPLQLYPDIYHVISLYQSGSRNNDTSFVGIVILYSQP